MGGHAGSLGIDPGKIVLCGASAGAWMAMVRSLQLVGQKPEDREQSPPVALVLFEPVCEAAGKSLWSARFPDQRAAKRMSPRKLLCKGAPPAIFMHGSLDPVVPFEPSAKLAKAWRGKSRRADFIPYEGAGHGFYNFNVDVRLYENTLNAADDFLVSLGYLEPGDSTVAL
jgi:acetyl esterase/lipase